MDLESIAPYRIIETPTLPFIDERVDLEFDENSFRTISNIINRYSDGFRISTRTRGQDAFVINSPSLIHQVLVKNHKNYTKGPTYDRTRLLFGSGIITSDRDLWKQQRPMVQAAFRKEMISKALQTFLNLSKSLTERWKLLALKKESIFIEEDIGNFMLGVMLENLFSDQLQEIILINGGKNPFSIFSHSTARNLNLAVTARTVRETIKLLIDSRRDLLTPMPDMLGVLMQSTDKSGRPMSEKALIDEVLTLLVGGIETTTITLTWIFYLLSVNPAIENKLLAELVDFRFSSPPQITDLNSLIYSKQIIFETIRLYPPGWMFSRRTIQNDFIGENLIPAGADIFISPYFLHRNNKYWKESTTFNPDRFNDIDPMRDDSGKFIPFALGPRRCIGDTFAMTQMQVLLAVASKAIKFTSTSDQLIDTLPSINLRARHPIKMRVSLRTQ